MQPRIDTYNIASKQSAFSSVEWSRSISVIPGTKDTLLCISRGNIEVGDRRKAVTDTSLPLYTWCGNKDRQTLVLWKEKDGQFTPMWADGDAYFDSESSIYCDYQTAYSILFSFKKTLNGTYELWSIDARQIGTAYKVGSQELEYIWKKGEPLNNRFMILALSLLVNDIG